MFYFLSPIDKSTFTPVSSHHQTAKAQLITSKLEIMKTQLLASQVFVNCLTDYDLEGSEQLTCIRYRFNNSIFFDEIWNGDNRLV